MNIIYWFLVLFGMGYSMTHAFFLWKDKNKLGAFGIAFVGCLIGAGSFFVRLK